MTNWRSTFDALEAAAVERSDNFAKLATAWISDSLKEAFRLAGDAELKLDGSDACERVAEALAVWIKESDAAAYANATLTRYSVAHVIDVSADGMERLRNWNESILLAYPAADATPDSLAEDWIRDMSSSDQGDGFSYDAAEHAIRAYVAEMADYLAGLIKEHGASSADIASEDFESAPFRLYLCDNVAERY